ncbi:hypothetical protein CWD77_07850 [Rhodohalobacter barkolensis]|uniref:Uncharacterized protein n=1 Tax=Rhodohalobacter barkolensis TaxID=2053187 RepID=A0A2N0VGZ9_9BACT|nr:hypothetical protein CWD77_07850 [Rhodohalobacter barkolensis]
MKREHYNLIYQFYKPINNNSFTVEGLKKIVLTFYPDNYSVICFEIDQIEEHHDKQGYLAFLKKWYKLK